MRCKIQLVAFPNTFRVWDSSSLIRSYVGIHAFSKAKVASTVVTKSPSVKPCRPLFYFGNARILKILALMNCETISRNPNNRVVFVFLETYINILFCNIIHYAFEPFKGALFSCYPIEICSFWNFVIIFVQVLQ